MERYQTRLKIAGDEGVKYYSSTLPVTIEQEEVPFFYISKEGDRLDNLAYAFYKSSRLWWVIARANNLTNGNIAVPTGTKLYIPTL